ncbi:hypothetical protein ZIOFF_058353 [Zingiber officinale]|uniref:3-hydroxyisobutyryl-CoA hydrolase n=1 Tax=Zingiber officinale TaxID=94328 RepID=A0A8J5FFJ1_ZINOF|nr:hypothetical protein ZIOFF_058353 [Zingiber officinale]
MARSRTANCLSLAPSLLLWRPTAQSKSPPPCRRLPDPVSFPAASLSGQSSHFPTQASLSPWTPSVGHRTLSRRSLSTIRCPLFTTTRLVSTHDDQPHNEVLVEGKASTRAAILNRPSNLNALTTNMAIQLKKLYESWEDNPDIGFVIMKGSGRAFCAGGDVVALYQLLNEGKVEVCKDFFRNLYMFIYTLGTYLKPHVAILDGVTMGGGAGVSIPGTFRVATDKTV